MTALGASSIPPAQLALGFLALRVLLPTPGSLARLGDAIKANAPLLVFVLYGIIGSYALPRIFAGSMQVPPLRFTGLTYIYAAVPLAPSSQNITTSVYMVGTLLIAICVHAAIRTDAGPRYFLRTAVALCWIHMILGVAGVALKGTPADAFFQFFRNGNYAQLDQSYGGFIRLTGITPEPSAYSGFAFGWFVLMFESWLRGIWPRVTGITAAAMGLLLVFSTSGLAYVGLGGYSLILMLRVLIPGSVLGRSMPYLLGALLGGATLVAAVCLIVPALPTAFGDMFYHMTVDKGTSESGLQRAFWAKKGFEAFWVSHGLGIGPGSFRSSSLITAVLGSMGVIGAVTFVTYVLWVLKPLRNSTYGATDDPMLGLGVAASWAALGVLIPQAVGSPSADPGANFAIFAAAALALRARATSSRQSVTAESWRAQYHRYGLLREARPVEGP
ncbi:glycoside hydrolase [Sphingomonas sp. TDK1]|uniref:glycoside hydrolase n=1 Tax=Sphingomonas sp. TDK1 TaxID=453247 RepID=UPI0012ED4E69|nr:glycoside hydrolase [Sphingomonas sp. TDK1]